MSPIDPRWLRPVSLPRPGASSVLLGTARVATPVTGQGATPLEDNGRITAGYIELATALHAVTDPVLPPGTSRVRPHWFCFAPHASQTAGKGMLSAALARRVIAAGRGAPLLSAGGLLDRVGLSGPLRLSAERLSLALLLQGLTPGAAATLGALVTAFNGEALADARTLTVTAARMAALHASAPGLLPLDKAEAVVGTLERLLHEGNVAIYVDVGGAATSYLAWRAERGEVTAERVLAEFQLEGAAAQQAQSAYAYALAHAGDSPRPQAFDSLLPGVQGPSLMVAAFALYEESRGAPTPERRDALIALANNYLAWQEQHSVVQPVFSGAVRAGEVSRNALMQALTPLLRVDFGTLKWTLADYAYARPDPDGNPLTSPPTEYNWALFGQRWPPILDAFELGYRTPEALWVMPEPLEDPAG